MGRPRKPTKLKAMAGAYEKNPKRRPKHEPEPPTGDAKPLAEIHEDGSRMWSHLAEWMRQMSLCSPVYAGAMQLLAEAYDDYYRLRRDVYEEGFVIDQITQFGAKPIRNPKAVEMHAARDKVMRLLIEFGLTPAAKSKVQAEGGEADDIEEMFFKVTG